MSRCAVFTIAGGISGVHMFLDAGASRELHWHALADEWAFVIDGHCQTVVLTPEGTSEINNYGPGDLWYFPRAMAMRSRRSAIISATSCWRLTTARRHPISTPSASPTG